MSGAGGLRNTVTFQRRALDANGDRLGPWENVWTDVPADLVWLRGSETAVDARLQGRQPVVIRVREDEVLDQMPTNGWQAVNADNTAQVFDIKSVAPDRERGFVSIMAEWEPKNA
ncbi:head-tail adaptor protein [Phenylobacterium sp.]|uniref:phage head completion protein n=1 Tax=Phenylobacterium sp. TaxID=1871053 RepID=UPI00392F0DCA